MGVELILSYKVRGFHSEKILKDFNRDGDIVFYADRCITDK